MNKLIAFFFICFSLTSQAQVETKLLKEGADLFYHEEYKEALKVFKKEEKKNDSYEVKFWIASCYFKMEDMQTAKRKFLPIVNSFYKGPELGMSLVNLGSCYRALKQTDSAFYYYNRAIELFPRMDAAYFNKAQLLYSLNKFEEAKQAYDEAIIANPSDWYYYIKRQEIAFILQRYDDALADMLKARSLKPDVKIESNMAYCYSMLERYSEADSLYEKIYDVNDPVFLNNYGFNKHKLGYPELGIEFIQKSIQLNPDNAYAYRNLAIIAIEQSELSKACEYLKKAKALNFFSLYGEEVDLLLQGNCD